MLIKRTALGKIFFTEISFTTSKKVLRKWLRRGQILEVSAAARSALFSACISDGDFAAASAIPHKTDLELALEWVAA